MESVKIFTRSQCPRCPAAKDLGKRLEQEGIPVFQYDVDTAEGLAEASFHGILSTPSLVIEDEQETEVAAWRGRTPTLDEVKQVLRRTLS